MPAYIALLRGINVSGHKPVPMAGLQKLFGELGFQGAKTYIQSGNVAFKAAGTDRAKMASALEKGIEERFGFRVPVLLRTAAEMSGALSGNPYAKRKLAEGERVYITFLAEAPAKEAVKALEAVADPVDELKVRNLEVYILARNGYGKSKLSNAFVERKLGVNATTRNLETTAKLVEMAEAL